ncbi:hypothetical protein BU16DRAFT_92781 [Lophium mytilinum]|uniref:Uncharacterized protein n=1 Tax=Lophium mytilinum TaxID=390894 RepID=A0A6A6QKL5_9PEZI|nr:hypothetical protein BU16DRAFT_92781 [Lophium mytilinum]
MLETEPTPGKTQRLRWSFTPLPMPVPEQETNRKTEPPQKKPKTRHHAMIGMTECNATVDEQERNDAH